MSFITLAIALAGLVCAVLPHPGMFVGFGLGTLAVGLGWVQYRRRESAGHTRLTGAAAIAIAIIAMLLSGVRYALTLAAIERIESLL